MSLRDFGICFLVCLFWGGNFIVSKFAMTGTYIPGFEGAPPFFFGFMRFGFLSLLLLPFLYPLPKKFPLVILVGLCAGGLHLAGLYSGLVTADASAAGMAGQLVVPFTVILSVFILKEEIGLRRGAAVFTAVLGGLILAYEPSADQTVLGSFSVGLIVVIIAFFILAFGSVIMKFVGDVSPWTYLAWMAVSGCVILGLGTAVFETGQLEALQTGGWQLPALFIYAALFASIIGHGGYYYLIKKYDPTLIVTLCLMSPLWAIIFGVWIFNEQLGPLFWIGSAMVVAGLLTLTFSKKPVIPPVEGE